MIQFNLLPDVKMKYVKARRQRRLVMVVAIFVSLAAFSVFGITAGYVYGLQGARLAGVNKSIEKSRDSIDNKNSQVDDINKVLTVQNQLNSLDTLHEDKPVLSRTFSYLAKLTPSLVTISKVDVTYGETNIITIQGSTDTLETINKFVDTIKFTTFQSVSEGDGAESPESILVFSDVVLETFGRDKQGASYTVTFQYDPVIFASSQLVEGLVVPAKVTTRSELGRPIFQTDIEAQNNAPTPVGQ